MTLIHIPLFFADNQSLFIRPLPLICSSAIITVPCLALSPASSCAIVCVDVVEFLCIISCPIHFVSNPHLRVFSLILFGKSIIRLSLFVISLIIYTSFFIFFLCLFTFFIFFL